jgi:hypothetical protein
MAVVDSHAREPKVDGWRQGPWLVSKSPDARSNPDLALAALRDHGNAEVEAKPTPRDADHPELGALDPFLGSIGAASLDRALQLFEVGAIASCPVPLCSRPAAAPGTGHTRSQNPGHTDDEPRRSSHLASWEWVKQLSFQHLKSRNSMDSKLEPPLVARLAAGEPRIGLPNEEGRHPNAGIVLRK